jgi:leucyl-tRNA synthetase
LFVDNESGNRSGKIVDAVPSDSQRKTLHQTIAKVTEDIESMRFNTSIAALMEFTNTVNKWSSVPKEIAEQFLLLLAPLAPHLAEELWEKLGHNETLAYEPWPETLAQYLKDDTLMIAVQVNGKLRAQIEIAADLSEEAVLSLARSDDNVARHLDGKTLRREIYVPGRIVNFVVAN